MSDNARLRAVSRDVDRAAIREMLFTWGPWDRDSGVLRKLTREVEKYVADAIAQAVAEHTARIAELEHEIWHLETVWLPEKIAQAVRERDEHWRKVVSEALLVIHDQDDSL